MLFSSTILKKKAFGSARRNRHQPELADAIEKASRDMRKAETRKVDLDAGA